jgi:hypothetical protein
MGQIFSNSQDQPAIEPAIEPAQPASVPVAYPPHLPPLISYFDDIDSVLLVKIVLIGDYSAGKTCLQTRVALDNPQMTEAKTTMGLEFCIKTIYFKGYKVKLQIWDSCMN